ncbi:HNH endonuclease signature motif containing protein [uncultured Corynebacterium sp.]|uniref:HNH endonuclease signature motif containing protein n=1 Tax=uncultured Corynebacterium sp. TaxID=159447 RepID=UPI0025D9B209|nr:HNH endonuclease signature motif containing protein [uncultured Corynebacterium sp.]
MNQGNDTLDRSFDDERPAGAGNGVAADDLRTLIVVASNALTQLATAFESTDLRPTTLIQLMPELKKLEAARRGLSILDLRIAGAVIDGELSRTLGTTRPDDHLVDEFRLTRKEAKTRVGVATFLASMPEVAGQAKSALRSGDVTLPGLTEMKKELENLDDRAVRSPAEIMGEVLERAPAHGPHGAGSLTRSLVRKENEPFPRDPTKAHRERRLSVGKQDEDGGAKVHGYLDAATVALLEAWLLAHGFKKGSHDDGRTPVQRNADALETALRLAHENHPRVPDKPMCTVVAALTGDDLRAATGTGDGSLHPTRVTARTGAGVEVGLMDLLRLGMSEDLYAAVFDPSAPMTESKLQMGRTKRVATFDQRIALQLLDGTCSHPGCTRAPDACDVHHLVAWLLDGGTDIGNLTLLCRRHHSDNDDTRADPRRGHMTLRTDDERGRTGWAYPAGADGTRTVAFNDEAGRPWAA